MVIADYENAKVNTNTWHSTITIIPVVIESPVGARKSSLILCRDRQTEWQDSRGFTRTNPPSYRWHFKLIYHNRNKAFMLIISIR